jgi:hypothetical protein
MVRWAGWLAIAAVLVSACSDWSDEAIPKDLTTDPPPNTPPALPAEIPPQGSVELVLTADGDAANDVVVSLGFPFSQGVFRNEKDLTVLNAKGEPVAITTGVLARWPGDGSIRSALVAFKASLAGGASEKWKIDYGTPSKSPDAGSLDPNPDGPILATLPAQHYAKSLVSGVLLPVAANKRFPAYDALLERGSGLFVPEAFGIDCNASQGRTYYDSPHGRYQRFLRSAVPAHYRAARREARWFRENELRWLAQNTIAIHTCESEAWSPEVPMDWGTLRMMLSQGMLDDYLVTGDRAAKDVVVAMGEAYRVNLPALSGAAGENVLEITERNLGWTLIGLASYFAVDSRNEVRDAARSLVRRAVDWQARSPSGALEHDVERPDPDECSRGPEGASPFMTSIVVDGMMDWWLLTADTATVAPFMTKVATWYEKSAITSTGKSFRYLWNCVDDPYDDDEYVDLNVLISHVFGATYALTRDKHWLDFGDKMATNGLEEVYAGSPKHWNQAARSFGKYLGYRALGTTP